VVNGQKSKRICEKQRQEQREYWTMLLLKRSILQDGLQEMDM
jgi:hypothetical protein